MDKLLLDEQLQIVTEQPGTNAGKSVRFRRQLQAGHDGPDHRKFQIFPRQFHIQRTAAMLRKEHFQ